MPQSETRPETQPEMSPVTGLVGIDECEVGLCVDVLDSVNTWSEAKVLKIDRQLNQLYITYLYWGDEYNEWITDIYNRVRALHTFTYRPGGRFLIGQRLCVRDNRDQWLESRVIEVEQTRVKIHYFRWSSKYDEYIDKTSDRIKPYGYDKKVINKKEIVKKWRVPGMIYSENGMEVVDLNKKSTKRVLANSDVSSGDTKNCRSRGKDHGDNNYKYTTHTRHISEQSSQYDHYISGLQRHSLNVVSVAGDGNCLFRSVAHQVYGDDELHVLVRQKCMDYMEANADFFSQFIEGGIETFHLYVTAKRQLACWGDDPEIQAMCEMYDRPAEIWSYDPQIGARKLRTFHEPTSASMHSPAMRLSYYGGGHYDSVCGRDHRQELLRLHPGAIEDTKIRSIRTCPPAVTADPLANKVSSNERDSIENAALNAALKISREEKFMSWADQDLETILLLSLNLMDDKNYASDKKAYSGSRDDEKKQEQFHEDDMIDRSSVEKISDIVATQSELLRNVRDESERNFLEDDLLQQACDASLFDASLYDEELERALNESLVTRIEVAEAKQLDLYQDEEELLRLALAESVKGIQKEYDEDEAMMRAIAASLSKT